MPTISESQRGRVPHLVRSNRRLGVWIAGFSAVLVGAADIYYRMFTGFSPYDDEGYVLITIRSLLQGHRLYNDVYSQYGPFYYLAHWAVYSVLGRPVSHDAERFVGVALWLFSAILWARTIYLLTHSPLWSGFGFLLGVRLLGFFPASAGHPEEICMALLSAAAVIGCSLGSVKARANVATMACLIAALALTKVNIGLYVAFAIGLVLLNASPRTPTQRFAVVSLSFAGLVLPTALMAPMLEYAWAREYAFIATASIGAAMLMACTAEPMIYMTGRLRRTAVLWFIACTLLIVLPFCFNGTTLTALLQMTVLQHADSARHWYVEAPVTFNVVLLPFASVGVLAIAYMRRRGGRFKGLTIRNSPTPNPLMTSEFRPEAARIRARDNLAAWIDLGLLGLKTFVGLTCLFVLTQNIPLSKAIIFRYCLPFSWLVLVQPVKDTAHQTHGGRLALCFLAVFVYLYAYPVAGSQVVFASVPAGVLAILLLRDATLEIANLLPAAWLPPKVRRIATALGFALFAVLFSGELRAGYRSYTDRVSLAMPGATLIRVKPQEAATYRAIISNVGSCSALYSEPGLFSLNLWIAQDAPTNLTLGNWVNLLDASQQRAVIRDLSRIQGLCIVYSPAMVEFWRRGKGLAEAPLAQYIQGEFVPVAESGGYYIMKRRTPFRR